MNTQQLQLVLVKGELRIVDLLSLLGKRFVKLSNSNVKKCPDVLFGKHTKKALVEFWNHKQMKRNSKDLAILCHRAKIVEKRRISKDSWEKLSIAPVAK